MFFESFEALGRVAVTAVCAYFWLLLVLRVTGKRVLSKLNAFDFAVTVAFGSTLATALLSKDVTVAEGALALAMLALLQYAVSKLSVHSDMFRRLVRSEPVLLVENGTLLHKAMKDERVTVSEIEEAIRKDGVGRLDKVAALVLETDGSFSVLQRGDEPPDLLNSVKRIC